ncbi:hypothetical protein ACFQL4_19995 [Halosimplex aquaticum]
MSQSVSRDVAMPLIVAILCIVGIGMIAATVDSAQTIGGGGGGGIIEQPDQGEQPGQENPSGPGEFGSGNPSDTPERNVLQISACIEFLSSTLGTLLVVVGFLGVIGLVYHRFNFSAALLTSWALLPPVALVYFLGTNCASSGPSGPPGEAVVTPSPAATPRPSRR